MASQNLYPPIVDSYMPAFPVQEGGNNYCDIYFRLSKFNAKVDFTSVHVSIVKQDTNMNVVKENNSNRYSSTGIILNVKPIIVGNEDDNLYYVRIYGSDLSSKANNFEGWIPDWTYKVQLRLSSVDYRGEAAEGMGQEAWLNAKASYFSEWSTICILKAIHNITYTIDILDIDTSNKNESINNETTKTLYTSTLTLSGHFANCGSEKIYSYNFILYDEDEHVIDNSGTIYANKFQDNKSFNYLVKTELENGKTYKLEFRFETINHYTGGVYKNTFIDGTEKDTRYIFDIDITVIDLIDCVAITADNDTRGILKDITSIQEEEEEGRIGIKLYSNSTDAYSGNVCVRRSSSEDNFKTWTDIKIFVIKEQNFNTIPLFYDYTIESGIWYRYGIQAINKNGDRGQMNISSPALRNFNYSFLLGKNNQQLKLMFDNSMNSFKIQLQESKIDPIGSKYPIVTRNAATRYKTFPLNGLITIWMDEENTFCNKKVIYKYEDVIDRYEQYNNKNNIVQYDYIYERDFRKLVLDFLHDGEFKLFKSPTEGNLIIRLTDINCIPNQSLDRMIYSFTSTAQEMAEATMDNYRLYGFYDPGEYGTDFSVLETKLGQIQMDFPIGTNIFNRIYQKYDSQGKNLGGYVKTLKNIHHIKITFDGLPLRITNNSGEYIMGNNFTLNGSQFTVYDPIRIYEFDERLNYTAIDNLSFLGDAEGKVTTIPATVDFLYDLQTEVYQTNKQIQEKTIKVGVGQLYGQYKANSNLYNELYYKYYIEGDLTFRRLNTISSIEIEANPGAVFLIKDISDALPEQHIINSTGQLRFYELSNITVIRYIGKIDKDGNIKEVPMDILMNYAYGLISGVYKNI